MKGKNHRPPSARSRREQDVQDTLREIFPEEEAIYNGYYSWLIGPKGHPMQIDIYYPNLGLAIEVDGKQHQTYSPKFHRSRERFEYLKACDRTKEMICKERGLVFVRIKPGAKIDKANMMRRLKMVGLFKRLPQGTVVVN